MNCTPAGNWCGTPVPRTTQTEQTLAQKVASLAYDSKAKELAKAYGGLDIMTVMWEDTGRYENSSVGPNISDMTLCVDGTNMPVIRKPNYSDITCDIPIDQFMLTVGNENGLAPTQVSLRDFLKNIAAYAKNPNLTSLYLERDEKILTSTQSCILPLKDGKVEFNVKLFNYQYDETDPAVLVIVSSQKGTSVQAITTANQSLYFNDNGMAADYVAQRLSEHRAETGSTNTGLMTQEEKEKNMLFVFQVPLKQTRVRRSVMPMYACMSMAGGGYEKCMPQNACLEEDCDEELGFEDAILSTGTAHSVFEGTGTLKLVRDERFPIRATLQFYGVTDSATIPAEVFKNIAEKLERVYSRTTEKGSLVVEKDTGRTTAHDVKQGPTPVVGPWWL